MTHSQEPPTAMYNEALGSEAFEQAAESIGAELSAQPTDAPWLSFDGLHGQPRPAGRPSRTTERKRLVLDRFGPVYIAWAKSVSQRDAYERFRDVLGRTAATHLDHAYWAQVLKEEAAKH